MMAEEYKASKLEIRLAFAAAGVIGLSIVAMAVTLAGSAIGISQLPTILAQIPLIGFPIGFLIIISLLVASFVRRSRDSK
jgi:hypothetical protein